MTANTTRARGAFTLLELMIAVSLLALLMGGALFTISRNSVALRGISTESFLDVRVGALLNQLEQDLLLAKGFSPTATLSADLPSGSTAAVALDSLLGLPDEGMLLLERGTAQEERISYAGLDGATGQLLNLVRGMQCTAANTHLTGVTAYWAALAEPIQNQVAPPPNQWDGLAAEARGPVYFRGDGTGFSYQLPTDPAGGTNYLVNGQMSWGATIAGQPVAGAGYALYFRVGGVLREADSSTDVNLDGDTVDVFDVGNLVQRAYDQTPGGAGALETGIGPRIVLQERCNWGGDLNSDGFDDPIFLWDPSRFLLHIRLTVLGGTVLGRPVIRRTETVIFLPNAVQN